MDKPDIETLFSDQPETEEGKYLVTKRDGTDAEWPHFVLGARDDVAIASLRFYGIFTALPEERRKKVIRYLMMQVDHATVTNELQHPRFLKSCLDKAVVWEEYRAKHGPGDPLKGRHRKDDPATIARMRRCMGA